MSVAFDNRFGAAAREIDAAASKLVRETALEIESDIKADMAGAKHGRTYRRRRTRDSKGRFVKRGSAVTHTASAPGEAPAIDTGALANSVQAEMDGPLAAEIGTPQEYAPPLEGEMNRPAFGRASKKAGRVFQRRAERLK
jgi:hypothetical protein